MNVVASFSILPALVLIATCGGDRKGKLRSQPPTTSDVPMERTALAASFVGRSSANLKQLLHDSVIVQPPPPDSARQGGDAIRYMLGLAENTAVKESTLEPIAIVQEGPFVFEQGIWAIRTGDRRLRAGYTLRWRRAPEQWKVVLWRWTLFK